MKKILTVLLAGAMLMSVAVFPTYATEDTYSKKLDEDVISQLDNETEDTVSVYIILKPRITEVELEQIMLEKYTWNNVDEYLEQYRALLREIVGGYVQDFVKDNNDLLGKIIFQCDSSEFLIAEVSKENITKLAELDTVNYISLFVDDILITDNEMSYKMDDKLQEISMTADKDELVPVWIRFKPVDMQALKKAAAAECGVEQGTPLYYMLVQPDDEDYDCDAVNEFSYSITDMEEEERQEVVAKINSYQSLYRHKAASAYADSNQSFLKECNIPDEQVIFKSTLTPMNIVSVPAGRLYGLCELDCVTSLAYYDEENNGEEPTNPPAQVNIREAFDKWIGDDCKDFLMDYRESFVHYTKDGQVDYAIVYAISTIETPMLTKDVFGDRIIAQYDMYYPFTYGYGVYDAEDGKFYDIEKVWNSDKYDGLQEAFLALKPGVKIGDVNHDEKIDINDVTYFQRGLAQEEGYWDYAHTTDELSLSKARSGKAVSEADFNRDGRVSIDDATALQRFLNE